MQTNLVDIDISITDELLDLVVRAAAASNIAPEAFILAAAIRAACELLAAQTDLGGQDAG
ncbi:hypothetical protein [Scleromatobacter humisilvae]|uniref:Uncharacterized protein n=1 Tax=Scleromatobacter humisilvae TaxID=2897159 RepID=A0A9X1YNT5_9BURK|nr:hypothetical protein [Scleromatobacter humisilvae]MCK9688905.1 hypothetical protein [Scleromatobacter humisilvae]